MLAVHQIINTPVPSNCFVIFDKTVRTECVIVDPGSKSDDNIIAFLDQEGLTPQCIILTHEHFDHCWGVNELVERYKIPVICSELCSEAIKNEKRNCSVFYNNKERFTINRETINVESLQFRLPFFDRDIQFIITPGHTEASICFEVGKYLFTGDTLIYNLRTVTKLKTGSKEGLLNSQKLIEGFKGKQMIVCPGHGKMFELDGYDLRKMFHIQDELM